MVSTNRTHTVCQCTHLTNFAILMDLQPAPRQLPAAQMLQVVNYIGSAVIILCLLFSLIITHFCIHGRVIIATNCLLFLPVHDCLFFGGM